MVSPCMRGDGGGGTRNDEEFDDENDLETADIGDECSAAEIMFVVDVASTCETLEVFSGSIFNLSARPRRM